MDDKIQQELWTLFQSLGPKAFSMTHYELAKETGKHSPATWKKFLLSSEVTDWVKSELEVLQGAELNKMLNGISSSNSVGKAQIINALQKMTEQKSSKGDGPIFIYCYVPLSPEQAQAENVIQLPIDPFII